MFYPAVVQNTKNLSNCQPFVGIFLLVRRAAIIVIRLFFRKLEKFGKKALSDAD